MQCQSCNSYRHEGPCPDLCEGCLEELPLNENRLCAECDAEIGYLNSGPSWPDLAEEMFNERTN
jgi:hypothetical protein